MRVRGFILEWYENAHGEYKDQVNKCNFASGLIQYGTSFQNKE
jgi:hypothetical protein